MSYQPVIPLSGYAGWQFLKRTQAAQQASFNRSPAVQRETAYFAQKIGSIRSADELLADRRLLAVALGAYGLEEDINSRAFLRKVLVEGTEDPKSFANRLADKRYLAFAKAFPFGDPAGAGGTTPDQAQATVDRYLQHRFEAAIGEQSQELRMAMEVQQGIAAIMEGQSTDNGRWYAVMANKGLRRVVESALGLPHSVGTLDVDQQLTNFRKAASRVFGGEQFERLATPEAQEKLVRRFLLQAQNTASPTLSAALTFGPLRR